MAGYVKLLLSTDGVVTYGTLASMVGADASASAKGASNNAARIDHRHQVATTTAGAMVAGLNRTANNAGTHVALARADHRHTISLKMNSVATAAVKWQGYKLQGELLNTAPSIGTGRIYFNTVDKHLYVYVP